MACGASGAVSRGTTDAALCGITRAMRHARTCGGIRQCPRDGAHGATCDAMRGTARAFIRDTFCKLSQEIPAEIVVVIACTHTDALSQRIAREAERETLR